VSKNFKSPLVSSHKEHPREQIQQDEHYQKPGTYPTNGNGSLPTAYPGVDNGSPPPTTPSNANVSQFVTFDVRGNGAQPGVYSTNGNGLRPGAHKINGYGFQPGMYPTYGYGSPQFKAPITPFSNVPETSLSNSPSMPGQHSLLVDLRFQENVKYYADWLAKKAKYDVLNDNSIELNNYIDEATKVVKVGGKEIAMFAPFRSKLSALQTFTSGQVAALCGIGLLWAFGLLVFRLEMLTVIIAAITVMYTLNLILSISMAIRTFRNTPEEHISDDIVYALKEADWPLYTILCPLYHEAQVVPQFVQAMLALDYPPDKLQILFLTEEDDAETRNAIRALSLPRHFQMLVVPDGKPRTKPRACNYGLMHAIGSYVVIYDAEDIPDPLQLKKAVLTFAGHETDVVCVQAKLNFYNIRQNLLTRWFTAEYSAWFNLILPGFQLAKFSLPLGGTSNHFRAAALRALGAWDAYNVTEDCDLGLRLKRYHMNTVILDSTTLEEANPQLKNWLRQRSRWIKGYMQTYLVHMRNPFEDLKNGHFYNLFSFQVVIGIGIGVMFINPLMWIMLGIYIVFGPSVINFYHMLFPGPILYLSAFCLIFGNFFYVYLYLLACTKRKLYHLLPWTLFIPIYWLLMSTAAFYALFELLVKPHYWQKTVHGLHLKGKHASSVAASKMAKPSTIDEPTMPVPVMPRRVNTSGMIPSVTMSLKAIPTLETPAISPKQKQAYQTAKQVKVRDLWLVAAIAIASIASLTACIYYFRQHQIVLYGDAYSHMRIARAIFDSATPGVAQFGGVWLPLPHILMLPFIWNDYLWSTGLAGSFVAMPCYVLSAVYIFLSARLLTRNSLASFLGTLVFILNPNILYVQSTPLSETVCVVTFTAACYYFLTWVYEDHTLHLVFAAAATFLTTLARYDGWPLYLAILATTLIISVMKKRSLVQIIANEMIFGFLGGFGIVLWLVWNKIIFGDLFYFQRGPYSAQAQDAGFMQAHLLYPYHNLWVAVYSYALNTIEIVGPAICILATIAAVIFILHHRLKPETIVVLVFFVPFAFYVVSLYSGQASLFMPILGPYGTLSPNHALFNVRYGTQMVASIAVFMAILAAYLTSWKRPGWRRLVYIVLLGVIVSQMIVTANGGIITVQDGQYGISCAPEQPINIYLAQHYAGGKILENMFTSKIYGEEAGVHFSNFIYEGSGQLWTEALQNPAGMVDWIIVRAGDPTDPVSTQIDISSSTFNSQFTLVARESAKTGLSLYHRNGLTPLPTRPVPPGMLTEHQLCNAYNK
jgi:cellulose synthase/poly-beta-1,6-N-acetylglucosamine synthase-like glycosyltransferase